MNNLAWLTGIPLVVVLIMACYLWYRSHGAYLAVVAGLILGWSLAASNARNRELKRRVDQHERDRDALRRASEIRMGSDNATPDELRRDDGFKRD